MKRILITGASGFIGQHLVGMLQKNGYQVSTFDGDITDRSQVKHFFNTCLTFDVCFHLAALSSVSECELHPVNAFSVNVLGAGHVYSEFLENCPNGVFIFASSAQIYGVACSHEKSSLDEDSTRSPKNVYAKSKWAAEILLESLKKNKSGGLIILRMLNHVHYSQRPDFFLTSVYQQLVNCSGKSESCEVVVGNVNVYRDMGAVQDLLSAFLSIIECDRPTDGIHYFNLGSGKAKSLAMLVDILAKKLGIEIRLKVQDSLIRKDDPYWIELNIAKFCHFFDWKPQYAYTEEQLIDSFLKSIT